MAFQTYFTELFMTSDHQYLDKFQDLIKLVIETEANTELTSIPSEEEIKKAVFSMGINKSPDPDGMTVNFYK